MAGRAYSPIRLDFPAGLLTVWLIRSLLGNACTAKIVQVCHHYKKRNRPYFIVKFP